MLKFVNQRKPFMEAAILLFLTISSCQKDATNISVKSSSTISLEEAKNWLSLGPSGIQPVSGQHRNPGTPDWGNAQFFKFQDKSSILKVPLIDYYLPVGYRDILFQKDSNGVILGAIQEIRPVKAYLAAKSRDGVKDMRQFVTNEDFTGDIIIFDPFDNIPLRGRRFKDGLVTGDLKYKSQAMMVDDPTDPPVKPKKKPGSLDDDGPAFEIDLPTVEVTAPGPRTPSTPGTDIPFPSEPVLPNAGGPVAPNNPVPIGGGSTSNGNTVTDIKNNMKESCMKNTVNLVTGKGWTNQIAQKVNQIFGQNNKYNITFFDRDAWPANYPKFNEFAAGTTYPRFVNGILKVDVYLNNPLLQNASQEYIAATLLHEIAHGILTYENIDGSNAQHNEMFLKYRKEMEAGLKEMFPGIGGDVEALAYEGLDGTIWGAALKTVIPKNWNAMVAIMQAYRYGNKGTKCSK